MDESYELKHHLDALLTGQNISSEDAYRIADAIASGRVEKTQLAALLVLLARVGESADVITGFAKAMRSHSVQVDVAGLPPLQEIVGTGGDGMDTVNISTAAAVLTAACGVNVAKHGSVSVSSRSGAADVLTALGVAMLGPRAIRSCLADCGLAFMFAPKFHPAMAHVVPVRKALKVRTVFNILGPLLNPAHARHLVLGVYQTRLLDIYADTAQMLGAQHALVVHCCGMDEMTPVGPTQVVEVRPGQPHTRYVVDPLEWGVARCTVADLKGGDPKDNAEILRTVLQGGEHADRPIGQTIALNAGAALYTYSCAEPVGDAPRTWPRVTSLREGYEVAREALRQGKGRELLDKWAATTQRLSALEAAQ